MHNINVLVACEESQAVAAAFRKRGFNAFSADIQSCSGDYPEYHIKGDVLPLLNGHCSFVTMSGDMYTVPDSWDLVIGFPPCTYLSNAGACRLFSRDGQMNFDRYEKGMVARSFFMSVLNCSARFVAVENPKPLKIYQLPDCSQEIQPFYFGDPFMKTTRLWLRNLPPLFATDYVAFEDHWITNTRSHCNGAGGSSSKKRSKTFPGVAAAMAEQWGDFILYKLSCQKSANVL